MLFLFLGVIVSSSVQAGEYYSTPWFQFQMPEDWIKVDVGSRFPSVFGPSIGGSQPRIDVVFRETNESLVDRAKEKVRWFGLFSPRPAIIEQRYFNTISGLPAHEYYLKHKEDRYRYVDILIEHHGRRFLRSYNAFIPGSDTEKIHDTRVLELVESETQVLITPVLNIHPNSIRLKEGDSLSLSVSVTPEDGCEFEWVKDGQLQGVRGRTYEIWNAGPEHTGDYSVKCDFILGEAYSSSTRVNVVAVEAAQTLHPLRIIRRSGLMEVGAETNKGRQYQFQTSPDLLTWKHDGPIFIGTGTTIRRLLPQIDPQQFWRLLVLD